MGIVSKKVTRDLEDAFCIDVSSQNVIGGFMNDIGKYCYCNALVQCLLCVASPAQLRQLGLFKLIAQKHCMGELQSLENLREAVGGQFIEEAVQYPMEFLDCLLNTEPYANLKSLFEIIISSEVSCCNSICLQPVNTRIM